MAQQLESVDVAVAHAEQAASHALHASDAAGAVDSVAQQMAACSTELESFVKKAEGVLGEGEGMKLVQDMAREIRKTSEDVDGHQEKARDHAWKAAEEARKVRGCVKTLMKIAQDNASKTDWKCSKIRVHAENAACAAEDTVVQAMAECQVAKELQLKAHKTTEVAHGEVNY